MTTLDDKLLGEKRHCYCSSDEEGGEDDNDNVDQVVQPVVQPEPANDWQGYSTNTGPKGVIQDFQKWKQLETEKRAANERQTVELAKQLSLSCQTSQEQQIDAELDNLVDNSDPILQEYMKKRMAEMLSKQANPHLVFGYLIRCRDGAEFLREIEQDVIVICHIYSMKVKECCRLNDHFGILARRHETRKFLCIEVNVCGMSARFEDKGCPAILVYQKGTLISSFVTVTDDLGSRFDVEDVESFLVERGCLLAANQVQSEIACESSKFRDSVEDQESDD